MVTASKRHENKAWNRNMCKPSGLRSKEEVRKKIVTLRRYWNNIVANWCDHMQASQKVYCVHCNRIQVSMGQLSCQK